jgi:hypothetical protein
VGLIEVPTELLTKNLILYLKELQSILTSRKSLPYQPNRRLPAMLPEAFTKQRLASAVLTIIRAYLPAAA